jgi:integrase
VAEAREDIVKGRIYKRGKTWSYVVDVGTKPKRKQQTKGGFRTKHDVDLALAEVLTQLGRGTHVSRDDATLAEYLIGEWLPAVRGRMRPGPWANYRIYCESYINPYIGEAKLQELNAPTLNTLYRTLGDQGGRRAQGLAPKTVVNVHRIIHRALADAMRWGKVSRNVADLADPPRIGRREMKAYDSDQLRTYLDAGRGDRLYALDHLAIHTGMRRGELLGLRWTDVDLDAMRLTVAQSVTLMDGEPLIGEPKTTRSRRTIALDPVTVAALRSHQVGQKAEALALGIPYRAGLVFTDLTGGILRPDWVAKRFNRMATKAGLPHIRFHDLRHSHATMALAAGVPAKVVSDRLGHSSVAITLDVYSHVMPSMDEDAATKVANLISGGA